MDMLPGPPQQRGRQRPEDLDMRGPSCVRPFGHACSHVVIAVVSGVPRHVEPPPVSLGSWPALARSPGTYGDRLWTTELQKWLMIVTQRRVMLPGYPKPWRKAPAMSP